MGGIAPQYLIGPSDFFTSDDLARDAKTLNDQINTLDDADWTTAPKDLFDAWFQFVADWRGWYKSTFDYVLFGPAWNDSNRDQLIQFETRFQAFAQQYSAASGRELPGGVVAPSTGAKDTLGAQLAAQLQPLIPSIDMTKVLWGVGLAVAAAAVYYFRKPLGRVLATGAA